MDHLGFLTIGSFDPADPGPGHETLLRTVELGEHLGLDSAWLRHRHLQHGVSSPMTVIAAASQRTSRIALGTAVTPLGWENPLRLAEDAATVDLLSGGRLNLGFSVGPPSALEEVRGSLYPDTADVEDFGRGRASRLLALVRGEAASTFSGTRGIEVFSDRVQPHSPGLAQRLWCGAASTGSARWAGEQGLNLLTSSVVKVEEGEEPGFARIQAEHVATFRAAHPLGDAARVSQGLVVIPTDGATADQRERYAAYAASRRGRDGVPQGPARLLFAPDLVGPAEQIAQTLHDDPTFAAVREVAFALPFSFREEDYAQMLTDIATRLGPALGWEPSQVDGAGAGRHVGEVRPSGPVAS